jgi:hypothetical protein
MAGMAGRGLESPLPVGALELGRSELEGPMGHRCCSPSTSPSPTRVLVQLCGLVQLCRAAEGGRRGGGMGLAARRPRRWHPLLPCGAAGYARWAMAYPVGYSVRLKLTYYSMLIKECICTCTQKQLIITQWFASLALNCDDTITIPYALVILTIFLYIFYPYTLTMIFFIFPIFLSPTD